ncbi:MAG: L-2-amino-thiazoline-4-carboxylic acid hydrolase [Candidatus Zixiibacteriota bacterium]|nr:MAG: L-2-amino-thiazoline-4-carboxylic acid hydrolase [candidate division Zixibacteria bacterium]
MDEIYEERLKELKPLIYCIQSSIKLLGKTKAKKLAKMTLEKYANERFVVPYNDIPLEKKWPAFRDDIFKYADDVQYSIEKFSDTMVRIRYKRCIFYEIFKDHGLADFVPLYCATDYSTARAVDPKIKMTRTQTIATGAECCDHCWEYEGK